MVGFLIRTLAVIVVAVLFIGILGATLTPEEEKKKESKPPSQKDIYKELLDKSIHKDIEDGNYEIKLNEDSSNFLHIYITFNSSKEKISICIMTGYRDDSSLYLGDENNRAIPSLDLSNKEKYYLSLISKKNEAIYKEKEKLRELQSQIEEDDVYTKKIEGLLKLTPLDDDLKEYFDKANKILSIGHTIADLTKEVERLRS